MSSDEERKLTKDEVETLLQATREEAPSAERREPVRRVQGYDFEQPSRFNKSQLDKLRRMNESLAQSITSHAPRLLRSNVKTQLVSMDHIKWETLLEEVGEEVVAFVFEMTPLGYRGLVTVDRQFAAACLDRMMGGEAGTPEATAALTDLDVRIFASFVRAFLKPLPQLWQTIGEFQVEMGAFVQDVQALDLFPPNEDLFQLCFLMQTSVGSGQIALSVPFEAVRSLPPEIEEHDVAVATTDGATEAALRKSLKQVTVELAAVLGAADVKVGKLVRAQPGDIILLDSRITDMLDVRVNDKVKFRAYPGTLNGKLAAKLVMEE